MPTATAKSEATPSTDFGAYRLLQRIGEGGMGEVWLAEQTTPIHRQVALKVIKAGMDTAHVVARKRSSTSRACRSSTRGIVGNSGHSYKYEILDFPV